MKINIILFFALIISCKNDEPMETTVIIQNESFQFSTICGTEWIGNQSPKCSWELIDCNGKDLSENINKYGYYDLLENGGIIFYSDLRHFGLTYGWHKVVNNEEVELSKFNALYNQIENSIETRTINRNGLVIPVSSKTYFDSIILHYGNTILNNISLPNNVWKFGVYKLQNNNLVKISELFNYDITKEDGVYFISLPGQIDSYYIDSSCSGAESQFEK